MLLVIDNKAQYKYDDNHCTYPKNSHHTYIYNYLEKTFRIYCNYMHNLFCIEEDDYGNSY